MRIVIVRKTRKLDGKKKKKYKTEREQRIPGEKIKFDR